MKTMQKVEVMNVRKWLAVGMMVLGLAVNAMAEDTVCTDSTAGCDKVVLIGGAGAGSTSTWTAAQTFNSTVTFNEPVKFSSMTGGSISTTDTIKSGSIDLAGSLTAMGSVSRSWGMQDMPIAGDGQMFTIFGQAGNSLSSRGGDLRFNTGANGLTASGTYPRIY